MRNEQNERKMNEDVGEKRTSQWAQILINTTMTTWTIISTTTQLICLDIEHGYDQRMTENLQTYRL